MLNSELQGLQIRIEMVLDRQLADELGPSRLIESMRYSTLNGGKRIRALLVYAAGKAVGAASEKLDFVAAAIECIHAYSLIHDDLPAMDDDDLRRGKPTNHIAFDEATAILAGDALLTLAFQLIASEDSSLSDQQARKITQLLSHAAGRAGMVGGQQRDIEATGKSLNVTQLEQIHREKTGALITSAVLSGAACGENTPSEHIQALQVYAQKLGLAFQVIDDVLDVEASTQTLGKVSGADAAAGKATYPDLIGLDKSKQLATNLYHEAVASLAPIGDNTALLVDIAEQIVNRDH